MRTVKALLLNGAVKPADWTNNHSSPLDSRYGAGVLNVFNSYEQLAGGKHGYIVSTSVATSSAASADRRDRHDQRFERLGFQHQFQQRHHRRREPLLFQRHEQFERRDFHRHGHARLEPPAKQDQHQQSRFVFIRRANSNLVACSTSLVDNVEHICLPQLPQGRYDLQVLKTGGTTVSASETYALAWEFFSQPLNIATAERTSRFRGRFIRPDFSSKPQPILSASRLETNNIPPPVVTNNQNYILLNATNADQFFRLLAGLNEISEREMFSDSVTVWNRRRDEIFSDLHRLRQIMAERERGANRGGISAAGAVRADAFHKRRGQKQFRFAVKKNVRRLRAIFQMAAFDQNRAAEMRMDFLRGVAHFFNRGNFLPAQNFRFGQIRRDERRQRQKFFLRIFTAAGSSNFAPLVEIIIGSTISFGVLGF